MAIFYIFLTCGSIEKILKDAHINLQITCKTVFKKIFDLLMDEPNNDAFAVYLLLVRRKRAITQVVSMSSIGKLM